MSRPRTIMIQDPVWNIPVCCVWNATSDQFDKLLRRRFGFGAPDVLTTAGVFFAQEVEGQLVGFIGIADDFEGSPDCYSILSHECLHCAFHMLKDRGLPYSYKTEEAYCYFHSFLLNTLAGEMLKAGAKRKAK
jgi:hypothetical protein